MSVRVLITGVGGGGVGEQLIKALRVSTKNYYLIGTDITPISKGLMEVDKGFVLPRADDPAYIESLVALCKREGVQVVFPGSEKELLRISQDREAIESEGMFLPIQPRNVIDICSDKNKTSIFLRSKGFSSPRTILIESSEDLKKIDFYPAVMKPVSGTGGSAGVTIVQSEAELDLFGSLMIKEYGYCLAQEYVGTLESEFTVGVLTSMRGELINSIAIRRSIFSGLSNRLKTANRSGRDELGSSLVISSGISQGEVGRFPEITTKCEQIASSLGATSALNIQCRFFGGEVFVFEINPRYSGTTSIRAIMGFNEPDIMIRKHLLGEDISSFFDYKCGYVLRGLQEVVVHPL